LNNNLQIDWGPGFESQWLPIPFSVLGLFGFMFWFESCYIVLNDLKYVPITFRLFSLKLTVVGISLTLWAGGILFTVKFFCSIIHYQITSLFVNVFQNKLLTLKADKSPFQIYILQMNIYNYKYLKKNYCKGDKSCFYNHLCIYFFLANL